MANQICPLRMLAQESINKTIGEDWSPPDDVCLKELCAWWNFDFSCCSITALATAATRPITVLERLEKNG